MAVYYSPGVVLVMDPAPLVYAKVFHPASGPEKHLRQKTVAVQITAKINAPVRTGTLRGSIRVTQNREELGQFAFGFKVYTPVYYAGYVHEGTGPSPRWPVNGKMMKFAGYPPTPVYRDFVWHPGTPANPFLQNALVAMAN